MRLFDTLRFAAGFAFIGTAIISESAGGGELKMGRVPVGDPLSSVKVTITVASTGEPLEESVDLHLGLGFPLRLYPLGGAERKPAFAAYPQKSSLAEGVTSLKPGESATFEFALDPAEGDGSDPMQSTRNLLRDLRVRDVGPPGFASTGNTAWVLAGYALELNGLPYVEHQGLNADVRAALRTQQSELLANTTEYETQGRQALELVELETAGLASTTEVEELRTLQASLGAVGEQVQAAALRSTGLLPWYVEQHEQFKPHEIPGKPIRRLEIGITTAEELRNGGRSGTANPVYFWADGRKYLLSSEDDPLLDGRQLQTFEISAAELAANPLVARRLTEIGIGILGRDEREQGPDRAKINRVTVLADGEPIYDSRRNDGDRQHLQSISFVPPVHRGPKGNISAHATNDQQTSLWKSTNLLPEGASPLEEIAEDQPAEPGVWSEPPPDDSSPLVIYLDLDGDSRNPRRRKRKPRPGTPATALNVPVPAPAGKPKPRPVTPQPGPNAPVLANIRINPAVAILRDGDTATVTWQISGNTANVRSYRVDLFGVLPHKNVPLINTPMATLTNIPPLKATTAGGSRTLVAVPPAINVAAIQSQLVGAEAQYLYVQPKVTALSANGTALVSGFGSLLPLFPKGYTSPPAAIVLPGAIFLPGGAISATRPPSFQVLPSGGATPGPWRPSATIDTQNTTSAWTITGEQDTSAALTFASYTAAPGLITLPSYNVGVRPAGNGERIAVQFEGPVPLPSNLPTPVKGWRVVGHVAFAGGRVPATAAVQTRVTVNAFPRSPAPFFTLQTPSPMTYTKYSSGTKPSPCLLIDMPVRFDLMAANNLAASPHDATKYVLNPPFVPAGPNGFAAIGGAGPPLTFFSVTLMIAMPAGGPQDAVGVFGLRLVPDNN